MFLRSQSTPLELPPSSSAVRARIDRDQACIFPVKADQSGEEQGVAGFHIVGAAAVEVSVLFDELEGIGGPVFAAGLDDIEVANEQDGLRLAGAVEAHDEIFLFVVGTGDDESLSANRLRAGVGHGFRGGGDVADGVGGVDFDQLLEDVVSQFFGFGRVAGVGLR